MEQQEIKLNQSPVRFTSETHQYFLGDTELKGITSTLIKRAYPDTYKGVPQRVLNEAAAKGNLMHETIELYDEMGLESDMNELQNYKKVLAEHGLRVIASEYIVSDEEAYATAIDKVMTDAQGNIVLVDLKRTSKIHYDNVSLQLSLCKLFFEMQNPHLKVSEIYVLRLRDDAVDFVRLNEVSTDFMKDLIYCDMTDVPFDPTEYTMGNFNVAVIAQEEAIASLETQIKELKKKQEALKSGLFEMMEKGNIKSWEGQRIKLTRSLPTEKTVFDERAFKEAHPDIYNEFLVTREVKGSLRITVLKEKTHEDTACLRQ